MDLITVGVVTYNSSDTVIETLEGIYNQTYQELELVVSDDGSKDSTVEIVKKWIEEHKSRFKAVHLLIAHRNAGVSQNCNRVLKIAKGKYLAIIAGDDIFYPHAIATKYEYALQHSSKIVFSKVDCFGTCGEERMKIQRYCNRGYYYAKRPYREQWEAMIEKNFITGPSGSFYNREYLLGIHGFDTRYPMLEDYPLLFRYMKNGNEIRMIDEALVRYRVSGKSLCTSGNKKFNRSGLKFLIRERVAELIKAGKYKICIDLLLRKIKAAL